MIEHEIAEFLFATEKKKTMQKYNVNIMQKLWYF